METRINEIADGIYRLSTFVPEIAPPAGFTFNQFLVLGDEPLLFHTGLRRMFPLVSRGRGPDHPAGAAALDRLRPLRGRRVRRDERVAGRRAPSAQVAHGQTGCLVSLNDMADRAPRVLADGEVIDLGGGKRVRYIDTPHVPHGWDAGVLYEETDRHPALRRPLHPARRRPGADRGRHRRPGDRRRGPVPRTPASSPAWAPTIRRLAELAPRTLALMHGPSFAGDTAAALRELASAYDRRLRAAMAEMPT